jgi:hypothetical protein
MYKMDRFTKRMFIVTLIAAFAVSAWRTKIPDWDEQLARKAAEDEQQFRISTEAAVTEDGRWCYGGIFDHLEVEKEYVAWISGEDRYIAQQLYTGDHYSDPRIMVVREESTGDTVQVMLLKSYEEWNKVTMALQQEVPD